MKVEHALSDSIAPLRTDDTVEHALGQLLEHRVRHLPVIDEADLLAGIISEDQLLRAPDPDTAIGKLLDVAPLSIHPEEHIFDAARMMVNHGLSTLPATRRGRRYVGLVLRFEIFDHFARMLATQQPGAILALEVEPRDYSLARLVHLIEQNDAKVLAVASQQDYAEGKFRVTLKLNVGDTARVRHVLQHNNYDVVAAFGEQDDAFADRIEEFMRYLEV
jgi:CBS-domain-containing membrane protein